MIVGYTVTFGAPTTEPQDQLLTSHVTICAGGTRRIVFARETQGFPGETVGVLFGANPRPLPGDTIEATPPAARVAFVENTGDPAVRWIA